MGATLMGPGGQRLRVVVAGLGRVALAIHLPLLREMADRFEVVGLVDVDRERAQWVATRDADGRWALTLSDLLDGGAPEVDAVLCATPWHTHADVVLGALDRGLAVLCEKPL